jgi:hypothetical protein
METPDASGAADFQPAMDLFEGKSWSLNPRLVLRVGVTGHRPPKLTVADSENIIPIIKDVFENIRIAAKDVLAQHKSGYTRDWSPQLTIISPLAEGADSLVAETALSLDLNNELQVALPAFRENYRADFKTSKAAASFDRLLHASTAQLELDGERSGDWLASSAYEDIGHVVVAHSDILIAIWDGLLGERGGTGAVVTEALKAGVVTIRIDPEHPESVEVLEPGTGLGVSDWKRTLRNSLSNLLTLPNGSSQLLTKYLNEPFIATSTDPIEREEQRADTVASRYATLYRLAYKSIYWLAPIAVSSAVLAIVAATNPTFPIPEFLLGAFELLCILMILILSRWGQRNHWHERWLDARMLAEQFRNWGFVVHLGLTMQTPRPQPFIPTESTKHAWLGWYIQAKIREYGLPSCTMTKEYLRQYQKRLHQFIVSQAIHQTCMGKRRQNTSNALERSAFVLFAVTGLACVAHLLLSATFQTEDVMILGILTAIMPAFGAAAEGLEAQGEYRRLAERADGMRKRFLDIGSTLENADDHPLSYGELVQLTKEVSSVMSDELSDWRNLLRTRDLHPV